MQSSSHDRRRTDDEAIAVARPQNPLQQAIDDLFKSIAKGMTWVYVLFAIVCFFWLVVLESTELYHRAPFTLVFVTAVFILLYGFFGYCLLSLRSKRPKE